jgi:transposase
VARERRDRAKPQDGDKRSRRIEAHRDAILTAVDSPDDITLVELAEFLRTEHGTVFASDAIREALPRFTAEECTNYFIAAGYDP